MKKEIEIEGKTYLYDPSDMDKGSVTLNIKPNPVRGGDVFKYGSYDVYVTVLETHWDTVKTDRENLPNYTIIGPGERFGFHSGEVGNGMSREDLTKYLSDNEYVYQGNHTINYDKFREKNRNSNTVLNEDNIL